MPFYACWLASGTLIYRGEITARRIIPFHSLCLLVSMIVAGLYFVGLDQQSAAGANPGLGWTVLTGIRVTGMAIGPAGGGRVPPKST
jgi:hypothetical protein